MFTYNIGYCVDKSTQNSGRNGDYGQKSVISKRFNAK
jgi:hypothetical protein